MEDINLGNKNAEGEIEEPQIGEYLLVSSRWAPRRRWWWWQCGA